MKVTIRSARGHERCPVEGCKTSFSEKNAFACPVHNTFAFKVYIDVTGRKLEKGRFRIYHAPDGTALQLVSAIALKQQIAEQIKTNTFSPKRYQQAGQILKFKNYKRQYLEKMRERARRPQGSDGWLSLSSLEDIEKYHRNYLHIFDDCFMQDITKNTVKNYLDGLKNQSGELASNTIKRKIVNHLSHLLHWGHDQEDINKVPDLPAVKKDTRNINVLKQEQQNEVIDRVPKIHRPILKWAKETGRRVNEYRAMKVRDMSFKRGEYYIGGAFDKEVYKPFPKVKEKGHVAFPLSHELKAILKEVLKDRVYSPEDYVFINSESGKPYTQSVLDKIFTKARKKAGYKVTLNEFGRHSFAVQLLESGATYTQVAVALNNTAQVVEKNYSKWNVAEKAKIINMRNKKAKAV